MVLISCLFGNQNQTINYRNTFRLYIYVKKTGNKFPGFKLRERGHHKIEPRRPIHLSVYSPFK